MIHLARHPSDLMASVSATMKRNSIQRAAEGMAKAVPVRSRNNNHNFEYRQRQDGSTSIPFRTGCGSISEIS